MFDSQKLNFESWLNGYKHGVYVFTTDTCSYCQKLKKEIEYINNHYLYFVEVSLQAEKDILYKKTGRVSLPMTVFYKDGDMKEAILGKLHEHQIQKVLDFLKPFGDAPLPPDVVAKRMEELKTACRFTYYIFTQTTTDEQRKAIIEKAIKHNEFPIDVANSFSSMSLEDRFHLLSGEIKNVNLVIYKDGKSNLFSDLCQKVLMEYMNKKDNAEFEVRNIDEELND